MPINKLNIIYSEVYKEDKSKFKAVSGIKTYTGIVPKDCQYCHAKYLYIYVKWYPKASPPSTDWHNYDLILISYFTAIKSQLNGF